MTNWIKPNIVISKCLNNHRCRYNGDSSSNKLISRILPFVNLIEVCPEEGIGLNTPRNPIRLVKKHKEILLIEPKTLKNYTTLMTEFSNESCISLKKLEPHGFIFKNKSPSCAITDANVYSTHKKDACVLEKASGLYSKQICNVFSNFPIEDDGRLSNFSIRHKFFVQIFTISDFYSLKNTSQIGSLVKFHTKNKFLFMSYSQSITKKMGKILANYGTFDFKEIFFLYESELLSLIHRKSTTSSMKNVFIHIYSHFSRMLRSNEKKYFFSLLDNYTYGTCPYAIIINTLKGYAIRFNDEYLLNQTLLNPYPEELIDFSDSGKCIIRK